MNKNEIKELIENKNVTLTGLAKMANKNLTTILNNAHKPIDGQTYNKNDINYESLEKILKDVAIPQNIEEFTKQKRKSNKQTFDIGDVVKFKKDGQIGEIIFGTKKGYCVIECEKEDRLILLSRVGVYCDLYKQGEN